VVRARRARKRLTPEQRRSQIIEAADRVFAGRDPAAVTFEDIAAEAGVSRALVYTYFGDKGGLLAAVYAYVLDKLDEDLRAALSADVPPRDRVRLTVARYLDFARSNVGVWHFLGHVASTQHPALQSARRARFEALAEVWGGTGEARIAIAGLIGLLEAATLNWIESPDIDGDHVAGLLEELAWSGIEGLLANRFEPERVPEPAG
jgi:AcrR family transcriptional regulator